MSLTGGAIATAASQYVGRWLYVFGGIPNPPNVLEGDCSSFVTMILAYRMRLVTPGGKWGAPDMPPHAHGPVVMDYVNWHGAEPVTSPQAGDLCCWAGLGADGHIGIAVSPTEMVSALDPADGCKRTPIVGTGPPGVPLVYRRVTGVAGVGLPVPFGQGATVGAGGPAGPLLAVLTAGVVAIGGFGLALLGAAVLVPWLVSKAAR